LVRLRYYVLQLMLRVTALRREHYFNRS